MQTDVLGDNVDGKDENALPCLTNAPTCTWPCPPALLAEDAVETIQEMVGQLAWTCLVGRMQR